MPDTRSDPYQVESALGSTGLAKRANDPIRFRRGGRIFCHTQLPLGTTGSYAPRGPCVGTTVAVIGAGRELRLGGLDAPFAVSGMSRREPNNHSIRMRQPA